MLVFGHFLHHCIFFLRRVASSHIAMSLVAVLFISISLTSGAQAETWFYTDRPNDEEAATSSIDDNETNNNMAYADITFSAGLAQREAKLRWNIASNKAGDKTPNILSELTFTDLLFTETHGRINAKINKGFLRDFSIEASFKIGTTNQGNVIDSDYNGDNRTQEYSRSHSNPEGSTSLDGKLLLGYPIQLNDRVSMTPLIGYNYSRQKIKMQEGFQVLDTRVSSFTPHAFTSVLDSSYETQWNSAVLALDTVYQGKMHQFGLRLEFFYIDYYAEANWNLRTDFAHPKSFAHWALGVGGNIEFNYQLNITPRFALWASYRYENWQTFEGDDVVYFANGDTAGTQLNEVVWESSSAAAGLAFSF
ncbi:MAG: hypothetical protein COA99_06870 [Moraxellaceae bacterium]|nr:MAG: hypothetical protein COA99_06870 [Moraxellaceae bacterium]